MGNPFDDEAGHFRVLENSAGQHSLWPATFDVPAGWRVVGPEGSRKACLDWIEASGATVRPSDNPAPSGKGNSKS